jgi:hypothetical protein
MYSKSYRQLSMVNFLALKSHVHCCACKKVFMSTNPSPPASTGNLILVSEMLIFFL